MRRLVLRHYLINTCGSALCNVGFGLYRMPEDCSQCILLLIIGTLLSIGVFALINAIQLLLMIEGFNSKQKLWIAPLLTVLPALIAILYIIKTMYKYDTVYESTDMKFWLSAAIPNFILNAITLVLVVKSIR